MDINKYTELTGKTVSTPQEAVYTAVIKRTKSQLETLLGFSLKPKYLYTEKGKVPFNGLTPINDFTNLLPPDDEEGMFKLFPYYETDQYFHVDPFNNIYRVKLVLPGNDGDFITVVDFENVVAQYQRDGIGKYIERHYEWFTWDWYRIWYVTYGSNSARGLQLAVDADWMDCYPDDLMYLWADMVSYYTDPNYSPMGNIRTESVDGHSWSRGNNPAEVSGAPQDVPEGKAILYRYAGPFGAINRNPVR